MRTLTYLIIFLTGCLLLAIVPKVGGLVWDPQVIIPLTVAMFTLLVWLVARFIGTDRTAIEVAVTALFIALFNPSASLFVSCDEEALIELSSQCIVPFFLTQYRRLGHKSFSRGYTLMLLMGIFCSFTHDAITIPLCLAFLMLAWKRRSEFFRLAIWPMVCGWVVGTVLQFVARRHMPDLQPDLQLLTWHTTRTLALLWDTKAFVLAMALTLWFTTTPWGRNALLHMLHRQRLIAYSLFFALATVPFAPLGIENTVTSVCFFAMLWAMLLIQQLIRRSVAARHFVHRHTGSTSLRDFYLETDSTEQAGNGK